RAPPHSTLFPYTTLFRSFPARAAHDEALFSEVAAVQPDLIVCAGYLRIIGEDAVRRFMPRMINIHPSLLPRHPGLDTHARALARSEEHTSELQSRENLVC